MGVERSRGDENAIFERRTPIPAPAREVFDWHLRPGALERLTPPWQPVEVLAREGGIADGGRVTLRMRIGPVPLVWVAQHREYVAGRQFRDVQVRGPFARWDHLHAVEADGPEGCVLTDRVEYALPGGALGRWLGGSFTRQMLERLFEHRHRITGADVAAHRPCAAASRGTILVTGSSGSIGSALVPFLTTGGHSVRRLLRGGASGEPSWDPAAGRFDADALAGVDAVVHLSGEGVFDGRWSPERKRRLRESRVGSTRLLAETIARRERPPAVLVCAAGIGVYGDRGDELLTEASAPGRGFMAELGREWEAAARPAAERGVRVVHLRFAPVLTPTAGALRGMRLPFLLGAGGRLGSGRQWWSWLALDDALGAIHHALLTPSLTGPVNAVAPQPVTNAEFTRTLGRVLSRPTLAALPAFALRLIFGERAEALMLASTRMAPDKLLSSGYAFRHPELEGALRAALGRPSRPVGTLRR